MGANCLGADSESAADLLVLETLRQQAEHVELALGQLSARCGVLRERGIEVRAAVESRLECAHEVRKRRLLEHERDGAGVQHFACEPFVTVGGVDDDAGFRRSLAQRAHEVGAGKTRHAVVDERQIRLFVGDQCNGATTIGRGPDDLESVFGQIRGDGRRQRGVVVGNQTARVVHRFTSI